MYLSLLQANSGKCVRIYLTVCLLCQTRVDPPKDGAPITRENISSKITYCSVGKSVILVSLEDLFMRFVIPCSKSWWMGASFSAASGIQERISKVLEAVHLVCYKSNRKQTYHVLVLKDYGFILQLQF